MSSVEDDTIFMRAKQELQRLERDWADFQQKGVFRYCCLTEIPEKILLNEAEYSEIEFEIHRLCINRNQIFSRPSKTTANKQASSKILKGSTSRKENGEGAARLDHRIEVLTKTNEVLHRQISLLRSAMLLLSTGRLKV